MIIAAGAMSCFVNSWMISHFGRKPVRGGRPAKDRSVSRRIVLSEGAFVHAVISVDSFRTFIEFMVRNTAAVIIVYR